MHCGRDMLRRIAGALAAGYAAQVHGATPAERLESLGQLLNQRRIPVSVDHSPDHPALTTHACPYPKLAEEDPNVCIMERMLFSELIGGDLSLTQCRLNGGADCRVPNYVANGYTGPFVNRAELRRKELLSRLLRLM